MQKIKVNDEVVVLAGKDKGKTGKITKIDINNSKVWVAGVNSVKKTVRASKENPNGGIFEKEAPIHLSNVSLVDPKTKQATRVRIVVKDGKKVRQAVKSGTVI